MKTRRILVTNAKGGCGKTTLATGIASHLAAEGQTVRLFDHDTQGSALQWYKRRDAQLPEIAVVDASRRPDNHMTRSWQLRVPPGTDTVILDTPAGISPTELAGMLQQDDFLIIPVLPSPIDIHASAYFIRDLLVIGKARKKQVRMAVVANRVRANTLSYHALERFLFTLKIPFITSLRDTQLYSRAFEQGIGILDLRESRARKDREQWAPLLRWLDSREESTAATASVTPLFSREQA
jgi:chromosome partitioning protein